MTVYDENLNSKGKKVFRTIIIVLLGILLFYPPYLRGLYFPKETLPTHLFSFLVFGLYIFYKGNRDEDIKFKTLMDIALIGLVIAYILPILLGNSANLSSAIGEVIKYLNYFVIFIMVSDFASNNKTLKNMLNVIVFSGLGVSILGIDAAAGENLTTYINKFFSFIALNSVNAIKFYGGFVDGNINATLQYKNACAAYLAAVFFITMALLIASNKKWQRAMYGGFGFIFVMTMILTSSKGVYIIFAFAVLLTFIFAPKGSKIDMFVNEAAIGLVVGIFLSKITNIVSAANDVALIKSKNDNITKIWIYYLLGAILAAGVVFLITYALKYLSKLSFKVYTSIIMIVVVAVVAVSTMAVTITKPLTLNHENLATDSLVTNQRKLDINKSGKYTITFDVKAKNITSKPWAWQVQVVSQTEAQMLANPSETVTIGVYKVYNMLAQREGKTSKKVKIDFIVPNKAKKLTILFNNLYVGTSAEFDNLKIKDPDGKEKNIALGYKFLPQSLSDKFANISKNARNVVERNYYTKDAIKIIKQHPIIGSGGGGWASKYLSQQSYRYFTTQAHNFFVQITVESGIIGLFMYLLLIAGFIFVAVYFLVDNIKAYKKIDTENVINEKVDLDKNINKKINTNKKSNLNKQHGNNATIEVNTEELINEKAKILSGVIPAALLLIIHSFIDFDLSLAAIFMLLWELLAITNSYIKDKNIKVNMPNSLNFNKLGAAIGTMVLVIYTLMLTVGFYQIQAAETDLKTGDSTTAKSEFESGISADPLQATAKVELSNLCISNYQSLQDFSLITDAKKYMESAVKLEKYNPVVNISVGANYLRLGEIKKGLNLIDTGVKLQPLEPSNYQQKAAAYVSVAQYYIQQKNTEAAKNALKKAINVEKEFKAADKKSVVPFEMIPNDTIQQNIQEVYSTVAQAKALLAQVDVKKVTKVNKK